MVDIHISILISFIVCFFAIAIIGIWKKLPYFLVIGGILWISLFVAVDNVSMNESLQINNVTSSVIFTDHMNQPTSNTVEIMRSGLTIFEGQHVATESSALNQKEVNRVTFRLDKDGNPTGNMYFGIWSSFSAPTATNYKFLIGQMVANDTSLSPADYSFTRNDTKTYTMQTSEIIGVFYNGGSAGNHINIARNSTASSFDGSNTAEQRYQSGWIPRTTDLRGKISLAKVIVSNNFDSDIKQDVGFTDNGAQLKLFFLLFGIFFMFMGAIIYWRE